MTDEITADEYRTAAKVLRTVELGVYAAEADWCDRMAEQIDTEATADDYVTTLAETQVRGESDYWKGLDHPNGARTYDGMTGDSQQAVRLGVTAVLARLAGDGRLVPVGGKALTAEEVADCEGIAADAAAMDQKLIAAQVYANRIRASNIWTRNNADAFAKLMDLFPEPEVEGEPDSWATWQEVPQGVLVSVPLLLGPVKKQGDQIWHWDTKGQPCCTKTLARGLFENRPGPFVRVGAGEQS